MALLPGIAHCAMYHIGGYNQGDNIEQFSTWKTWAHLNLMEDTSAIIFILNIENIWGK